MLSRQPKYRFYTLEGWKKIFDFYDRCDHVLFQESITIRLPRYYSHSGNIKNLQTIAKINMKKIIPTILGVILIYSASTGFSDTQSQIQNTINRIIAKAPNSLNAGVIIEDLTDGKILYETNPNRYFVPASNLKLFTAYAALKQLGANYTFATSISIVKSQVAQGTLNGNVYLQFSGDPSLTSAQLNSLIAALTSNGISKINGNFVIVNNDFDSIGYGPGWLWDDLNYCYDQPINAMAIDHNCFTVGLAPAKQIGQISKLYISKNAIPFNVSNAIYSARPTDNCSLVINSDSKNNYVLNGCVNIGTGGNGTDVAVNNVNAYVSQLVKKDLAQNKITLNGSINFGSANPEAKPLLVIQSKPLLSLVATMLQKSDDFYAGVLFKKVGQSYFGGQGTWDNAQKAAQAIIQTDAGIYHGNWIMVDGSGISRYNMLTPQQVMALLLAVYKSPTMFNDFMKALAIGGINGTIQYRFVAPDLKGRVFAKTGTMTGVSSLSGFIKAANHHTLAFTILMNNFIGQPRYYEGMQDEICGYLARTEA